MTFQGERKTADQMALEILLDDKPNKQERIAALSRTVSRVVQNRVPCPDCGHKGPHDDNGLSSTSDSFAMCCAGCGAHFNPYGTRS